MRTSGIYSGLLAVLLALGAFAEPAAASAPKYSLSIVEGETTLPEYPIEHTSASAPGRQEAVVEIFHEGTEVARSSGEGGTWLSKVPAVGDVVKLESPSGNPVESVTYDGLPSIDPTVCAGSANFSGKRSEGEEVEGGYFSLRKHAPYSPETTSSGHAQVTTLSGTSFSGSFLSALSSGDTVYASETVKIPLAGSAIFEYSSENQRPVGGCPTPVVVIPPPPESIALPVLKGSIVKLPQITIRRLLKSGWSDQVAVDEPATVTQNLYLQGGTLPAYAASRKHKRHVKARPALLLARGSATARGAGDVTVSLKLTPRGRRRLRTARSVKAILITTLRTASGQVLSLGHRSVLLHR